MLTICAPDVLRDLDREARDPARAALDQDRLAPRDLQRDLELVSAQARPWATSMRPLYAAFTRTS
jgi:hypothetical protein